MFGIGTQELLIILVLVLVIFGAKKLPEIGGGLGKAIRNFRQASTEPDEIDITPKSATKAESAKSVNHENSETVTKSSEKENA